MNSITSTIEKSWKNILKGQFNAPYFLALNDYLIQERKNKTIFPPCNEMYRAYNFTPIDTVKVVIIGQDPYHGENQANGLCFSVKKGISPPPSLVNIFKEQLTDVGVNYPTHGDLTSWAKQGVLLLNATLTVRQKEANSHQNSGWQEFTDATISAVSDHCCGVVFLLWGGFAKKKIKLINTSKHFILTSGHPSPLSANRGYWFGNKHFSKTNTILKKQGKTPIDWQIK